MNVVAGPDRAGLGRHDDLALARDRDLDVLGAGVELEREQRLSVTGLEDLRPLQRGGMVLDEEAARSLEQIDRGSGPDVGEQIETYAHGATRPPAKRVRSAPNNTFTCCRSRRPVTM